MCLYICCELIEQIMRYCRESGFVANTCFFGFVLSRLTQTFRILLRFCADIWTKYWLLRPLLGLLQCCTVSMRKVSKLISFIFRFNALLPCPSLLPTLRSLKSSWTRGFASRLTTAVRLILRFLAYYPNTELVVGGDALNTGGGDRSRLRRILEPGDWGRCWSREKGGSGYFWSNSKHTFP